MILGKIQHSEKLLYYTTSVLLLLSGCATQSDISRGKYWHSPNERPYVIHGVRYYPQVH